MKGGVAWRGRKEQIIIMEGKGEKNHKNQKENRKKLFSDRNFGEISYQLIQSL
jgi:hypothetical protein